MARTTKRLNANEISRLGPGRYHDGNGLYLVVGKGAARSWILRYMRDGRAHQIGLGPVRLVGLAEARKRALEKQIELNNVAFARLLEHVRRSGGRRGRA